MNAEQPQAYDYPDVGTSPRSRIKNINAYLNAFGWDDHFVSPAAWWVAYLWLCLGQDRGQMTRPPCKD